MRHCHVHHVCTDHGKPGDAWMLPCSCRAMPPRGGKQVTTCGDEFVKWFWTGPWLVTCRLRVGHGGEHSEIPEGST